MLISVKLFYKFTSYTILLSAVFYIHVYKHKTNLKHLEHSNKTKKKKKKYGIYFSIIIYIINVGFVREVYSMIR